MNPNSCERENFADGSAEITDHTPAKDREIQPGHLVVVVGGTASGKSSLSGRFLASHPEYSRVITSTTRPIREGEVNGRDYYFVSSEEFAALVASGAFIESTGVYQHRYGTLKSEVEKVFSGGKVVWLVDTERGMDFATGSFFNQAFPDDQAEILRQRATVVMIDVSSRRERRRRFLGREGVDATTELSPAGKEKLRKFLVRFREELPGLTLLRSLAERTSQVFLIENDQDVSATDQAFQAVIRAQEEKLNQKYVK